MGAALDRFRTLVDASDGSAEDEARVHAAFREARRAYKQAEGLIAFLFPSTADLLNMAALPHVEDEDPNEVLRPPQGFQVIEERIFPAYDATAKKDVLAELRYLRAAVRRAKAHAGVAHLTDRHVFEAMWQQLIRLQAHGLVGFDSPVALASLEEAFTDGLPKSVGFDFQPGPLRNAPTVINAGLQRSSAYDLTTETVEQRIRTVVENVHEMNASLEAAAGELRLSPAYVERFEEAFGELPEDEAAAERRMARGIEVALADYVRSLSRLDSPFDRYARGETDALPEAARRGFNLFMGKALCGTCHFAPLFNGVVPLDYKEHEAEIIGVPERPDTVHAVVSSDLGKHALFKYELHEHAFKTPTVRNVALTAPYMHNGVYATLEEVVDFYNRGGGAGIGIDLAHQTLPPEPLNLTEQEMADLVAFMEALTDTTGLSGRPAELPAFPDWVDLGERRVGGEY